MRLLTLLLMPALLFASAPTASAIMLDDISSSQNLAPRGYRRALSRSRDLARTHCGWVTDIEERRACIRTYQERVQDVEPVINEFRQQIRQQVEQRCGEFVRDAMAYRRCLRGHISTAGEGRRDFSKRATRTKTIERARYCASQKTSAEKLRCLRSDSNPRPHVRKEVRPRLEQKQVVDYILPSGLRRNLSRTRDIVQEQCGSITNGQQKRDCYKRVREALQQ